MDENQARSSVSMFRIGAFPRPPGSELRDQDKVAGSLLAFARAIPVSVLHLWRAMGGFGRCEVRTINLVAQCYRHTPPVEYWAHCPYCWPTGGYTPGGFNCNLVEDAEFNRQNVCAAQSAIPYPDPYTGWIYPRPRATLAYKTGVEGVADMTDAEGSSDDFLISETWRYYLQSPRMQYYPCLADEEDVGPYCGGTPGDPHPRSKLICRWYSYNSRHVPDGWDMNCVQVVDGEQTEAVQTGPRDLSPLRFHFEGKRAPVFVRFRFGPGSCFHLNDTYVFTNACYREDEDSIYWGCIGNGDMLEAYVGYSLWAIYLLADPRLNTADIANGGLFPHLRADDIHVKNNCWDEVRRGFAELYDAHKPNLAKSASPQYYGRNMSAWVLNNDGRERFQDRVVNTEDAAGSLTPLAITMYEPLLDLHLPAELVIDEIQAKVTINVESRLLGVGTYGRRCFGAVWLHLTVRPRLVGSTEPAQDPENPVGAYQIAAAAGLAFMDATTPVDRYNTIIEDPDNPGAEHPHLKLLATGPDGGRIPYQMEWEALSANMPYSYDAAYAVDADPVAEEMPWRHSCWTLQAIANAVFWGEFNNHAYAEGSTDEEPIVSPQIYLDPQPNQPEPRGSCSFAIPGVQGVPPTSISLTGQCNVVSGVP